MKRYLLFACENYYPAGGMGDFEEHFNTIEEAKQYVTDKLYKLPTPYQDCMGDQFVYIYDTLEMKDVENVSCRRTENGKDGMFYDWIPM